MGNEKIIKLLENFELFYKITGDRFRARAYNLAISAIRNYPVTIKTEEEASKIYNIGKGSIAKKIGELLKGKTISEILPEDTSRKVKLFSKLVKIQGFGLQKAKIIIKKYKVSSFEEFMDLVTKDKIKITHEQKMGIKYYKDFTTPIEHSEMQKIDQLFKGLAKKIDKDLIINMVGSYRRKRPFSNDIDLLLSHPDVRTAKDLYKKNFAKRFYDLLTEKGIIVDPLKIGSLDPRMGKAQRRMISAEFVIKTPFSVIHHKVDMKFYPMENYFTALVYFTGSKDFNEKLRRIAKRKGLKLSDFALSVVDSESRIIIKSEEDLFKALGQKYISPENR